MAHRISFVQEVLIPVQALQILTEASQVRPRISDGARKTGLGRKQDGEVGTTTMLDHRSTVRPQACLRKEAQPHSRGTKFHTRPIKAQNGFQATTSISQGRTCFFASFLSLPFPDFLACGKGEWACQATTKHPCHQSDRAVANRAW